VRATGLVLALVLLLAAAPALADDPAGGASVVTDSGMSDAELDRRLEWLETTLDDGATYGKIWQYGWTSGYSLGVVLGTVQAATTNHRTKLVNGIVTASKAAIGTGRFLIWPHPARLGADPMREVTGDDRAAKLERLAAGEAQLEAVAARADVRWDWKRHAGTVGINSAGAGFALGYGRDRDALINLGIGVVVGEIMIFTSPTRGAEDLSAYQRQFAATPTDPGWKVSLVPMPGGAGLKVDF
jgi:hypothetical protein